MEKINSENSLRVAILQLEKEQAAEIMSLKAQYLAAYESVKPINLVKNTVKEITATPELKDEIINASIGLATGYVSKLLFQGNSHSPLRKLFGTVLMFGITNAVTRHPEVVKSLGKGMVRWVTDKNRSGRARE